MSGLLTKQCGPCHGETEVLKPAEAKKFLSKVRGWKLAGGKILRQEFVMRDFSAAISFIQKIARTAESEGHHPDLHLTGYRNLAIEISTHAIGGLSINDFILAAKIDALPRQLQKPARQG